MIPAIEVTGETYPIRIGLRKIAGGIWDAPNKRWLIMRTRESQLTDILADAQAQRLKLTIQQVEVPDDTFLPSEPTEQPTQKVFWDSEYEQVMKRIGAAQLDPDIKRALKKMARIDRDIKELDWKAEMILSSSPYGQTPPIYHSTMNKVLRMSNQKAPIWNEIRSRIVKHGKTLWQIALTKLPVESWGEAEHVDFYVENLLDVIDKSEPQPPTQPPTPKAEPMTPPTQEEIATLKAIIEYGRKRGWPNDELEMIERYGAMSGAYIKDTRRGASMVLTPWVKREAYEAYVKISRGEPLIPKTEPTTYEPFKEKPKPAPGLVVQKLITQEAAQLQAKFDVFGPPKQRAPKFPERKPEPVPLMQQTLFPTQAQIAEQQKREAEQRTVEQRKKQWSLWSQETI